MTEKSGATFGRFARHLVAVAAIVAGASGLSAQGSTGKVEGTVSDPNGQPVVGAQVTIIGTSFAAQTDQSGYWFINNVPAGVYEMQAQYIGFQPSRVTGLRVLADQTLTVNFDLSTAVELGAINIVAAQNPIVPRDQVSSKTIVTGSLVNQLPVDNVRAVLELQPGVVESGRGEGVSIRGGRPGEAAVYIDGALVRSVQEGGTELELGTNALEEASVTTGAIGAEFGDAQSGVVAYVTSGGGSSWGGSLAYETDEVFGDAMSVGGNRIEGNIGGPLPLMDNLTFNLAATVQGQQSDVRGAGFEDIPTYVLGGVDTVVTETTPLGTREVAIPRFIQFGGECDPAQNFGFECQGRRAPYNWQSSVTTQAKVQYSYGSGSRLSLTNVRSSRNNRNWNAGYAYQRSSGSRDASSYWILNLNQQISRSAGNSLALEANLSYQTDETVAGPMARDFEVDNRSPFGGFGSGMEFLVDFDHFTDEPGADVTSLNTQADWDRLVTNVRTNTGTRLPYLNRTDLNNAQPYRMNPFALSTGYSNNGLNSGVTLFQERRLQGRFLLDWQANRYNRIKVGGDVRQARVNYFSAGIITQSFMDVYTEEPASYGAFIEDRLDLGDVVVDLGLRWDAFDTGALISPTPGATFSDPAFDPANPTAHLVPMASHSTWSPRIRVSFPVTVNTGFRLSYAHQVQSPDFSTILLGINNDLSFTNTNDLFARDVGFGKSIQFEFGIRHAFSQDLVLDIAAYNKDKVSDLAFRILEFPDPQDPTGQRTQFVNVATNADFGNVRGIDAHLTRRIGDVFSGTVGYTFQIAKSTGSDPTSYISTTGRQISGVTGERVDPPQAILPTEDNRTHNIVGAMSLTLPDDFGEGTWYGSLLRNTGAFVSYRFASGLPFTLLRNDGNGQTAPFLNFGLTGNQNEPINSSELPWLKELDLRLTRGFVLGGLDLTAYADIRNLFNFRSVVSLFAETGDVVNQLHRENQISPEVLRLENDAAEHLTQITTADGETINAVALPSDCGEWSEGPVDCVLLKRAEARFGDGDGVYDANEYTAAFTANYVLNNGTWQFFQAPRHIRLGVELRF